MKPQSNWALLDIKLGRRKLEKAVRKGERLPIVIRGFIAQTGNDDGTSTEFTIDVTGVDVTVSF